MTTNKAPGVYINEVQLPPSIVGVGTSTAGFVGSGTTKSPSLEALMVTSFTEFRSNFGDFFPITSDSPNPQSYLAYAVYAFFQQGGNLCYIVNTNVEPAQPTAAEQAAAAQAAAAKQAAEQQQAQTDAAVAASVEIQNAITVTAKQPGSAGNAISVSITIRGTAAQLKVAGDMVGSGNNAQALADSVNANAKSSVSVTVLSGQNDTKLKTQAPTSLQGGVDSKDGAAASLTIDGKLLVTAKQKGVAGNQITVEIYQRSAMSPFNFKVNGAIVGGVARTYGDVITIVNNEQSIPITVATVSPSDSTDPLSTFPETHLTGGVDPQNGGGGNPGGGGGNPGGGGDDSLWSTLQAGLECFEVIDDVNLIVIPDLCLVPASDLTTAMKYVFNFCATTKQDCFFIADVPHSDANYNHPTQLGNSTTGFVAVNQLTGYKGFGAVYYPYIQVPNPALYFSSDSDSQDNVAKTLLMPPSGAVAGNYAATDASVGVYKPAAGIRDGRIAMALSEEVRVTETTLGLLNSSGINNIRSFPGTGPCIWGARTTAGEGSEWKYLSVRRLFIFVEQSLKESLRWVVFEPNTPKLWGILTRNITAFLTTLWREGAFFGDSAEQAFFVKIDAENNPPAQRRDGYLNIDIGIAPVFPAEFVIINIGQKTLPAA
ncbi:phage tail sheath C-terminal domain-containing protein [Pseudoalteromonas sp. S16_S37]|uniref:phage tail sheath C-terminal domain-containing protein n=1 Tax=Pseudoalteromonas sp. S16_S37 TaxID=2720228 RepID=UPI0016806497|nr:phage tail sheath C-terminal domain-containing protein [Pseudoalteromonas sp. S16_S37]MBD1580878.1 hypothetical protein [Pseudoalteromonas sp. S16_S37]